MTEKNYCVVQSNVVTNIVYWDGNLNTWQPPEGALMLEQDITPAMVWIYEEIVTDQEIADHAVITGEWKYEEVIGAGQIGFTWDGTKLITNEPDPTTL